MQIRSRENDRIIFAAERRQLGFSCPVKKQPVVIRGKIQLVHFDPDASGGLDKEKTKEKTDKYCHRIGQLQDLLYANSKISACLTKAPFVRPSRVYWNIAGGSSLGSWFRNGPSSAIAPNHYASTLHS